MSKKKRIKKKGIKKQGIKKAVRDERERCCQLAADVVERYQAMGFRHDAAKAAGALEVLRALGMVRVVAPFEVQHVAGLTAVYGD